MVWISSETRGSRESLSTNVDKETGSFASDSDVSPPWWTQTGRSTFESDCSENFGPDSHITVLPEGPAKNHAQSFLAATGADRECRESAPPAKESATPEIRRSHTPIVFSFLGDSLTTASWTTVGTSSVTKAGSTTEPDNGSAAPSKSERQDSARPEEPPIPDVTKMYSPIVRSFLDDDLGTESWETEGSFTDHLSPAGEKSDLESFTFDTYVAENSFDALDDSVDVPDKNGDKLEVKESTSISGKIESLQSAGEEATVHAATHSVDEKPPLPGSSKGVAEKVIRSALMKRGSALGKGLSKVISRRLRLNSLMKKRMPGTENDNDETDALDESVHFSTGNTAPLFLKTMEAETGVEIDLNEPNQLVTSTDHDHTKATSVLSESPSRNFTVVEAPDQNENVNETLCIEDNPKKNIALPPFLRRKKPVEDDTSQTSGSNKFVDEFFPQTYDPTIETPKESEKSIEPSIFPLCFSKAFEALLALCTCGSGAESANDFQTMGSVHGGTDSTQGTGYEEREQESVPRTTQLHDERIQGSHETSVCGYVAKESESNEEDEENLITKESNGVTAASNTLQSADEQERPSSSSRKEAMYLESPQIVNEQAQHLDEQAPTPQAKVFGKGLSKAVSRSLRLHSFTKRMWRKPDSVDKDVPMVQAKKHDSSYSKEDYPGEEIKPGVSFTVEEANSPSNTAKSTLHTLYMAKSNTSVQKANKDETPGDDAEESGVTLASSSSQNSSSNHSVSKSNSSAQNEIKDMTDDPAGRYKVRHILTPYVSDDETYGTIDDDCQTKSDDTEDTSVVESIPETKTIDRLETVDSDVSPFWWNGCDHNSFDSASHWSVPFQPLKGREGPDFSALSGSQHSDNDEQTLGASTSFMEDDLTTSMLTYESHLADFTFDSQVTNESFGSQSEDNLGGAPMLIERAVPETHEPTCHLLFDDSDAQRAEGPKSNYDVPDKYNDSPSVSHANKEPQLKLDAEGSGRRPEVTDSDQSAHGQEHLSESCQDADEHKIHSDMLQNTDKQAASVVERRRVRVFSKAMSQAVSRRMHRRASKMRRRKLAREKEIISSSGLSVDAGLSPIVEAYDSQSGGDDDSRNAGGDVRSTIVSAIVSEDGVEVDDASFGKTMIPESTSHRGGDDDSRNSGGEVQATIMSAIVSENGVEIDDASFGRILPILPESIPQSGDDDDTRNYGGEVQATIVSAVVSEDGIEIEGKNLGKSLSMLPKSFSQVSKAPLRLSLVRNGTARKTASTEENVEKKKTTRAVSFGPLKRDVPSVSPSVDSKYFQHGEPDFFMI